MARILISILSEYLQPNFLLIKEFEGKYDKLAFITTEKMRQMRKVECLKKALHIEHDSVSEIEVVEDDLNLIKKQLLEENFSKEDEYLLNVTGGTKVIPIAVCEFFKDYKAQFFYVPIGKNVIRNIYSDETVVLTYRMNLEEYFTLNGLKFESNNEFTYDESVANRVFHEFQSSNFNRNKYKKIKFAQELPDPKDKKYYAGEWFEDYCYFRLKREMELDDDCICKGAKIFRNDSAQNDNEIDVMFVKDNQLHIFECKVTVSGAASANGLISRTTTIENYMYKLAAIAKDYGFRPKSYILTLQKLKPQKYSCINTAAFEGITRRLNILGINDLLDCSDFNKIDNLLKLKNVEKPKVIKNQPETPQNAPAPSHPKINISDYVQFKVVGKIDLDKFKK